MFVSLFLCYLSFVIEGATVEAVALLVFLILVGHCMNFKTEMWLCLWKMRSSGIFLTNKFYHCNWVCLLQFLLTEDVEVL